MQDHNNSQRLIAKAFNQIPFSYDIVASVIDIYGLVRSYNILNQHDTSSILSFKSKEKLK